MSSVSKLIFTPQDYLCSIAGTSLAEGLQRLGWAGGEFARGPASSFFTGEDFFKYITFMGCAPAMRLEPESEADLNFCFIHVNTDLPEPIFRGHRQRFVPRCPACRHGLTDWAGQLDLWQHDHAATFACPHCGAGVSIPHLNWREKAAVGRCFIEVYSVYPHEGIPTATFMTQLKTISGVEWKYFYEPG